MARIRTLKPEFWQSQRLVGLPPVTRLIFIGLISQADDAGRLLDNCKLLEALLFAADQDFRREVVESLSVLADLGLIRRGRTGSGQAVIQITGWARHQRVDHPNLAASLPEILEQTDRAEDTTPNDPTVIHEALANDSRTHREVLAPHIYDLRSTTNDQRSTTNDQRSTTDMVGADAPTPLNSLLLDLEGVDPELASRKASSRRRPAASAPLAKPLAKYPHFPNEVRAELMAVWRDELMPLREDQKGRFVQAFAGWFTQPEAERPPHLPTNSEVVTALREMLVARRGMAGGERLAVPGYAAERIGLVVDVLRENTADPFERAVRFERLLGLFSRRPDDSSFPGSRR